MGALISVPNPGIRLALPSFSTFSTTFYFILVVVAALVAFLALRARERRAADVRATRAEITETYNALSAYRADHDRSCPGSLGDLVATGYMRSVPRDAWGKPLRVVCPGRRDPAGFEVSSDGPDGEPGGTDRIE